MSRSMLEKECLLCKTNFLVREAEVKRGNGKYCSLKCSQEQVKPLRISKLPIKVVRDAISNLVFLKVEFKIAKVDYSSVRMNVRRYRLAI